MMSQESLSFIADVETGANEFSVVTDYANF